MNKKLPFTIETRMANVIHLDYRLIPIIDRFGIEYGFGNKSILEVCEHHNINVWFFLEIVNSYHNHDYFPKKQLQNFNAEVIITYLANTHKYYTKEKIPEIQSFIDEMESTVTEKDLKNVQLLNNFFKDYKYELQKHLDREESIVFPYVLSLENSIESRFFDKSLIRQISNDLISNYESSHDNMEVKLSDLKNLIIRHLPPVLCKALCQRLLSELFRLESDLKNHSRIEEKVLIPKVKLLEQTVLKLSGSR